MHESINTRHSEITPRTQTEMMQTGLAQTELPWCTKPALYYLPRTYSSKIRWTHRPRAPKPLAQTLSLTASAELAQHGGQRGSCWKSRHPGSLEDEARLVWSHPWRGPLGQGWWVRRYQLCGESLLRGEAHSGRQRRTLQSWVRRSLSRAHGSSERGGNVSRGHRGWRRGDAPRHHGREPSGLQSGIGKGSGR